MPNAGLPCLVPLPSTLTAAELQVLASHENAELRRAVAAHPNAPADLLGKLAAEFPGEVLNNPALPLLRLPPDFLAQIRTSTRSGFILWHMRTLPTALLVSLGLLGLSACTPTTSAHLKASTQVRLPTYQAPLGEVYQAIRDISASFASLPASQQLVIWEERSKDNQVTLTTPNRIAAIKNNTGVFNVLDERELVFLLTGKNGLTTLDYRQSGNVSGPMNTVLSALDKRFVRVEHP